MILNWIKRKLHIESPTEPQFESMVDLLCQPYYNKIPDQEGVEERRLIDPEKLIEQRFSGWENVSGDEVVAVVDVVKAVKLAPTEAVTGLARWNGERGEFTCSHCGESAPLDGYLDARYCYGCGYLMKNSSKWEEEE